MSVSGQGGKPNFNDLSREARDRPQGDSQAKSEQNQLEGPSAKRVRKHAHRITECALWFGAILFAVLISVRFWHLISPHEVLGFPLRWLTSDEIKNIDSMLLSSALGGAVLSHLRDVMVQGQKQEENEKNGSNS